MEQEVRNKLRNVVTKCRKLLEESIGEQLQGQFGIHANGKVEDESDLTHLGDEDIQYRRDILDQFEHIKALGYKSKDALAQLVREIAFTHLNRFCAYKMMAARDVRIAGKRFRDAVGKGLKSQGFLFYLADHAEDETLYNSGKQDVAYRHFLDWLGAQLSEEIGVLFNPNDPANRLYPPQRVLDDIFDLLNGADIKEDEIELRHAWPQIWSEDETIGWVYQYFTPKELRDQARKESAAPRNSYELAFRNQFFTPRYVVEFLTDNTLGRIWYEMRRGETRLMDECQYIVRRPNEIFLAEGEEFPSAEDEEAAPSQEELLRHPVHIPHRPKKDPRELRILDPACGSGHFLLYCFDLLLTIYDEAYNDPDLGPALQESYPDNAEFAKAVPGLILSRNLHGIDIDLRASQIAALALWLRCQRAFQTVGLSNRPKLTRSNVICAEPMPGEKEMLKEFTSVLQPKVLGQLIEIVFEKMKLAGDAGSLLKTECDLQQAIVEARKQWQNAPKEVQLSLFEKRSMRQASEQQLLFDTTGITDEEFWDEAESNVLSSLREYAAAVTDGKAHQRHLFADDAARGFAFIDLCQQRFDVVVMNPPFGDPSICSRPYMTKAYSRTKHDVYAAFVERSIDLLVPNGMVGAITSRTGFFLSSFRKWREEILLNSATPVVFADLGHGVLDTAMVETAAYCLSRSPALGSSTFIRSLDAIEKDKSLQQCIVAMSEGHLCNAVFFVRPSSFIQVPSSTFAYWVSDRTRALFAELPRFESDGRRVRVGLQTSDDFRFVRCWWEVPFETVLDSANGPNWREDLEAFQEWCKQRTFQGKRWVPYTKGGEYSPFYADVGAVVDWEADGRRLKEWTESLYGGTSWSRNLRNTDEYFQPGLTWPLRGIRLSSQAVPAGCCFSIAGKIAVCDDSTQLMPLLALMNSRAFDYFVGLFAGKVGGVQYEVGLIGKVPIPDLRANGKLAPRAMTASQQAISIATNEETNHYFVVPRLLAEQEDELTRRQASSELKLTEANERLQSCQADIDSNVVTLYALNEEDKEAILRNSSWKGDACDKVNEASDLTALISYAIGCIFGRWDIRNAREAKTHPTLPDPFAPLPVCSPGMLQEQAMPLTASPSDYPLSIDWDGIVVDDESHQDDIVSRIRDVFEILWPSAPEQLEQAFSNLAGVSSLRTYIRKPGSGGFWHDHVKSYSGSRRKAPIYWLLQSSKKNYSIWIYYVRLEKDTLFKALSNYVEPKRQREENHLAELRSHKVRESGSAGRKLDRDIERQEDLLTELGDFEERLRKVAEFHLVPDLNDGVVLNIAPLHEFVPWNVAKKYWDELLNGKYEWSSISKQLREKRMVKD